MSMANHADYMFCYLLQCFLVFWLANTRSWIRGPGDALLTFGILSPDFLGQGILSFFK
jgi:hypothetical protein